MPFSEIAHSVPVKWKMSAHSYALISHNGISKHMPGYDSIVRISANPVTSKISMIVSFTFMTFMLPCLFIRFCAPRRTRSPEAEEGDVSIGFMDVPGTKFTIELMCYHNPKGRQEPVIFKANDISGARHVALKVINIEEAFEYIKAQPDVTLINTTEDYQVNFVPGTSIKPIETSPSSASSIKPPA